jgi:hypothetical protein
MTGMRIVCTKAGIDVTATLDDSQTASDLVDALPVAGAAQRWGREVYFGVPLQHELEAAVESVAAGDIAYWPPGAAFCIFFGQQPYSAVTPLGRIDGDASVFEGVGDGDVVRLEPLT